MNAPRSSPKPNMKYVYLLATAASLGGLLFGYDTAVISGAIGNLQTKFSLSAEAMGAAASAAIWGCVFGVMCAGYLSDRFGRKKILIASAALFIVSAIGSALPNNISQFALARFVGGLGVGMASMLSPLYISEIAPAQSRGRMVTLYQLAIVLGINLIYFVNLLIAGMGDELWNVEMGWRYMLGSEAIPATLFIVLLLLVPESPRWLTKQGLETEALRVLTKINGKERGRQVLEEVQDTLREEKDSIGELFSPGLRTAMLIGIVLAIFSQITGINAIIYYAPEIFKSVGFGTETALLQTVVIGLTNTLFTFVAIWLMDKTGRRKLLIVGVSGMIICLAGMGAAFYFDLSSGPVLLLFILGYIACFASSLGPIPWVLISEIFPTKNRGTAMSFSIVMLWLSVVAVTQFFPIMLERLGGAPTFWIFMINAMILVIFVFRVVPETKQKTLEEIEASWRLTK